MALVMLFARLCLGAFLTVSAMLKLFARTPEGAVLSQEFGFMIAIVECVAVLGMLLLPRHRWPMCIVVGMACSGAVIALTFDRPCGCSGPIVLSRGEHFLMAMTVGALGSILLLGKAAPCVPRTGPRQ